MGGLHVEPLGLYSKKVTSLAEVPQDAVIAIPADATNQARALFLLEDAGLLKLNVDRSDPKLDYSQITPANVSDNPKKITSSRSIARSWRLRWTTRKVNLSVVNEQRQLCARGA